MGIKQQIEDDIKQAMRDKQKEAVATLRMLKAKLQEREVALRADKGRDYSLDDEAATQAVSAYAKQRRDSIESYEQAGREDLAAAEKRELAIVQTYLPEQLDEAKIREIVHEAIAGVDATGPQAIGMVMKAVMPKVQGRADGKLVNRIVRESLA